MPILFEGLGEDVGGIFCPKVSERETDIVLFYVVSKEMSTNINVFHFGKVNWDAGYLCRGLFVCVDIEGRL